MEGILESARRCIRNVVQHGDVAIDATLGNGYDTLFLAQLVGPSGTVYGFDIQEEAFQSTRDRLETHGMNGRVTYCDVSHDQMEEAIPESAHGEVSAIMFNLGYLPGSDKTIITQTHTTVRALGQSVRILKKGGRITVVAYLGHEGGKREAGAVEKWARALSPEEFQVSKRQLINLQADPPQLFCIEKR